MLQGKYAEVADRLFEVGAVQFGAFRLKHHQIQPDAPLSPVYLNVRTPDNPNPGPVTQELAGEIAALMYELIQETRGVDFRYVAGLPGAADLLADELMKHLDQSSVTQLRLATVEDEGGSLISGVYEVDWGIPGNVLLVDDFVASSDSELEAVSVLEEVGLEVRDLVVLVDYEQGGTEYLVMEQSIRTSYAFTLTDLLEHYADTGKIAQAQADEAMDYLAASRR